MELVVLVDEHNNQIGTQDKASVHSSDTPLHRGFSLFLVNSKNELLLTRRSQTKKAFPGIWSNSVCGHPAPGETTVDAAKRRLKEELGITGVDVKEIGPYRYTVADINGIVENEICPILLVRADVTPVVNKEETSAWKWIGWKEFLQETTRNPASYSPWSVEEAKIINSLHILDR